MFGWLRRKENKPKAKAKAQKVVVMRGAWESADVERLLTGWATISEPINKQLEAQLRQLRARSRDLAKNDPYMRRFFSLARSNIVGPKGIQLRSTVLRGMGRRAGQPDEIVQQAIESAWAEFSKPGVADAKRRYSMRDIQNMAVESLLRDGEAILYEVPAPWSKFGVAFRFIDPELMDVNHTGQHGRRKVRMGVETDDYGVVTAYHFHSTDSTHDDYYQVGGQGYVRIPASRIIHVFVPEYIDQLRGYPHAAAAMLRLRYLNGYEKAELVAARTGAATMGFIERGENGRGFEGEGIVADDADPDAPMIEAEPGAFHYLDHGAKLQVFDPSHPPTAYKDYVKGVLRGIASGLGVDYNTLANDLEGVNFSSLRGGLLESRELWKSLQEFFIEHLMDPIFERWLETAVLRGAIKLPNGDPLRSAEIDRYRAHYWQPRRWAWVDPVKDIQAAVMAINNGLRSRSDVIREQGGDPEHVWAEIERENATLAAKGITIGDNQQVDSNDGN